jgi:ribose-phosphate pyrophosphokinase
MERGAKSVRAFCTHPVLSGKAYENINNSALQSLVVCDTIPLRGESSKIQVLQTATLFATAIRNTFENKSISSLFIHAQRREEVRQTGVVEPSLFTTT